MQAGVRRMGFETYQALVEMLAAERSRVDRAFEALRLASRDGGRAPAEWQADSGAAHRRDALHDCYQRFHSIAIDHFRDQEPYLCALEGHPASSAVIAGHRGDHLRIAEWLAAVARELETGAAAADVRPLLELAYLWLSDHRETHDAALLKMHAEPV